MKNCIGIIAAGFVLFGVWSPWTTLAAATEAEKPFLAIWRDHDPAGVGSPCLRIAIWSDGRVLYARNPTNWSSELLEGTIDAARIAELKKAVEATGVFGLEGYCYLVPSAPVDCVMLDFGGKQQMLYWDEVENPKYGINIDPRPHHLEFIRCWKEVNRLALAAVPKDSKPYPGKFERPPASWRLKKPIQSK